MHTFLLLLFVASGNGFTIHRLCSTKNDVGNGISKLYEKQETSTYEATGESSKGVVSALTDLVNFFFPEKATEKLDLPPSPQTPTELMQRIQDDYILRNYLWTGDIDLACFDENCKFTDPTISFESRDTFVRNTANLKVLVDKLTDEGGTASKLLNISVTDDYVETRWNMVGDLTGLPWKPRIDVIGRTKFWFRDNKNEGTIDNGFQVYFYDEAWEMPASKALLQLITPAGNNQETD